MNALTHWNPFKEMDELNNRLASRWGLSRTRDADPETESRWMPRVDVSEDDKGYHITAELPGLSKDDVNVTLEDGVLRLTGERKFEEKDDSGKYHRVERVYGRFERSFRLPKDADATQIKAEITHGVLDVTVAKKAEAKPRQIDVKFN